MIATTCHANMLVAAVDYRPFTEVEVLPDLAIGNRGVTGCCRCAVALVAGCISYPSFSSFVTVSVMSCWIGMAPPRECSPEEEVQRSCVIEVESELGLDSRYSGG